MKVYRVMFVVLLIILTIVAINMRLCRLMLPNVLVVLMISFLLSMMKSVLMMFSRVLEKRELIPLKVRLIIMLRRNESNRFSQLPQSTDIRRSHFSNVSFRNLTTGNAGFLYPLCAPIEVLPGDEFKSASALLTRMQTPLNPVMDTAYLDTFWFYVPNRLLWSHWKNFMGESDTAGVDPVEYFVPTIEVRQPWIVDETVEDIGNIMRHLPDYFGVGVNPVSDEQLISDPINVLPFRAYWHIWNNFFRDQNLQDAYPVNDGDSGDLPSILELARVNKLHDYFTSSTPYPQKGPDVLMPVSGSGLAPVVTSTSASNTLEAPLLWHTLLGDTAPSNPHYLGIQAFTGSSVVSDSTQAISNPTQVVPSNLFVDIGSAGLGTIIQLRQAFAVQRLYENFALYGSRYYETLYSSFGVVAPQLQLALPEYLGGSRVKIDVTQVSQTTPTDSSPLGANGAYSLTTLYNQDFDKSFVEHGYIIGLYCVRNANSYQNGLHRLWSRRDKLDFYWPELANVGSQPVYNKEIFFLPSASDFNDEVFGYQERYAEYRYFPSTVTGEFRSGIPNSMDEFHYADHYNGIPRLSSDWLYVSPNNIDRTLAVQSSVADQFYSSFKISFDMWRKMPLYGGHSIQGWY